MDVLLEAVDTLQQQVTVPHVTIQDSNEPSTPPSALDLVPSILYHYRHIHETLTKSPLKKESSFRWQGTTYRVYTFGVCMNEFVEFSKNPYYNMFYYSILYQSDDLGARIVRRVQSYDCAEDLEEEERNGYLLDDLHYVHEDVIQGIYKELYKKLMLPLE